MKVTITGFAKQQIRETARYINKEFGRRYRDNFMRKVLEVRQYLALNPNMGPVEPLLSDCSKVYRSVVIAKLNKMVYYIADDQIVVVDFWDVRREPEALAAQVKE